MTIYSVIIWSYDSSEQEIWLVFIVAAIAASLHLAIVIWVLSMIKHLNSYMALQLSLPASDKQIQWRSQQEVANHDHVIAECNNHKRLI